MKNILFITLLLLVPLSSKAAEIYFSAVEKVNLGQEIVVELMLDTENELINAVSGEISVSSIFSIEKIFDGDTALSLWVENPKINKERNSISLSGITPGGVKGEFKIISFVLKPIKEGEGSLSFKNYSVLSNDGKGTSVNTKVIGSRISVSKEIKSVSIVKDDSTPPEKFKPEISKSQDLFDGNYFISFSTTDKGVGVDHYEWSSSFLFSPAEFKIASSPIELSLKNLIQRNFIKAVDRNGNERVVSIAGSYYYYSIFGLLIGVLLLLYFIRKAFR